ncbi:MAG: CHASE2 domain-containing protein, partial [Lachnospiraceae bacterium]|nr:CHASE2 domain-containing protein [Lachnospiraceae bacterium]
MKKYITCALCAVIAFFAAYSGIFGSLDKMLEDNLYHNPGNINSKIRIIKIDDRTMNQLGDLSTWNRDIYAELIEALCVSEEVRPAVIGFDILFSSEKGVESDQRFADACEEYGNVVCGFSYAFTKELVTDENGKLINNVMSVQEKIVPYEKLESVTQIGFANALMDNDDSIIRSTLIYFDEADGTRTKSFSAAVYENYMKACGMEPMFPTEENIMSFRYSGGPEDYENVSMCDVLDGTIPAEAFDDCIVLVGVYAAGMLDSYFIPVDRGQQMYGVEIHANAIQAIMESKTLDVIPAWVDGVLAAVIAILLVLLCERLSVLKTIILCGLVAIVKLVAGLFLFQQGYSWNNLVVPVMAILIAIYYTGLHYYKARKAKQSIEKAFSKYVAPQVVDEIAKSGTYELKLGGENREVAVLFVDIRGFTPLSESLEPEQV